MTENEKKQKYEELEEKYYAIINEMEALSKTSKNFTFDDDYSCSHLGFISDEELMNIGAFKKRDEEEESPITKAVNRTTKELLKKLERDLYE